MNVSQEVLAVLSNLEFEGSNARIVEQLDRKLYLDVNKVLEACGGKWNRKAKAHIFDTDASELIDAVITTGTVMSKADIGFFPTPVKLAIELVELAGVKSGDRCLEPSAGTGRLVDAMLARGATVWACERDGRMREYLDQTSRHARLHVLDADDFLAWDVRPTEPFDAVVMNPPFIKVGKGDHLDHVRHAFWMLKPGGVLVSVLPASVTFRTDKRYAEFRKWTTEHAGFAPNICWKSLPEGSFKESGTLVRTVVAKLAKR